MKKARKTAIEIVDRIIAYVGGADDKRILTTMFDTKVRIGERWWDIEAAAKAGDRPAIERILKEVGL